MLGETLGILALGSALEQRGTPAQTRELCWEQDGPAGRGLPSSWLQAVLPNPAQVGKHPPCQGQDTSLKSN